MNTRNGSILFALLAVLASACSSMGPEECAATDWWALGYEDGARGLSSEHFGNHRTACAKHGITADFSAYRSGRAEGLVEFCQPSRGYDLGVSGGRYHGVCDTALEEEFLDAYRVGHQLYTLRSNVYNANAQIDAREAALVNIDAAIREKQVLLVSDGLTPQERVLLLGDIQELARRSGEIETEIAVLVEERAHHQGALNDYETTVAAYEY